uniref:Secretagogin, EF-hand calcium binding protein n=1 Tax=Suricata suricatta TaxID=37032 RepID=A0A673TXE6_SURSU
TKRAYCGNQGIKVVYDPGRIERQKLPDAGLTFCSLHPQACSTEERKRDFEKIFAHYDVSKTGALEGPEVDGFVKDVMELVQPSISGVDLDKFREILLRHCDVNKDGKIQKSELALCLGLKINP